MSAGPLDTITVVELCSNLSGPFATKILGDMGAEVIKVESPERGEIMRFRDLPYDEHGEPDFTWRFLNYNTSKKSMTLDLKSQEGNEILAELVRSSDVLVENMSPGAMERLGYDWERLHEINDELIYCSIKGYDRDGPYAHRPALDVLMQGTSGFAHQIGEGDGPGQMNVFVVDLLSGIYAAGSISMALYERERSGKGQMIDISMLDSIVSILGHQLAEYSAAQRRSRPKESTDVWFSPMGYYETDDGNIGLLVTPDHWEAFCRAIDRPGWADGQHEYGTNERRLDNERFTTDLEDVLKTRTTAQWMDHFDDCEETILAAPVKNVEEMIEDPQVQAQNTVRTRTHPTMGEYLTPNIVAQFSRTGGSIDDAPDLGDSTDEVLSDLGYSSREREKFRRSGVID